MPSQYYLRNFQPGHHYHIYNRGAHRHPIFKRDQDYLAFTDTLAYYLQNPNGIPLSHQNRRKHPNAHPNLENSTTYRLLAYCLMPNHFHLLFHQLHPPQPDNSISSLMRRLSITYAMYFKDTYRHSGALFQGRYKNKKIDSNEQLLQVTKYMHLNPGLGTYHHYPFSSYQDYLQPRLSRPWLDLRPALSFFSSTRAQLSYQSFVEDFTPPSLPTSQALLDL